MNKALNIAIESMGEEEFSNLEEFLSDTDNYNFKITDKPVSLKTDFDEEYPFLIYVNQTTNGGYTGDDFSGKVSIALPNGKYLTYNYSC